jgi:hypothetical protein
MRHGPPKRRVTFNGLHGILFQKIELFIITAERTSNPTGICVNLGWYQERSVEFVLTYKSVEVTTEEHMTQTGETTNTYRIWRSGRGIAQAVSRWLLTAAARVRARVWSCGICGGQSGAGTGFRRVLRPPLPIFIPQIVAQSPSSINRGW